MDAGAITHVDYTAAQVVRELQHDLAERSVKLVFAHVQSDLKPDLERHRSSLRSSADKGFSTVCMMRSTLTTVLSRHRDGCMTQQPSPAQSPCGAGRRAAVRNYTPLAGSARRRFRYVRYRATFVRDCGRSILRVGNSFPTVSPAAIRAHFIVVSCGS